jgi:iron complex transport system permease protein
MQALTRNPLADPGLLGVSQGAATGVVAAIAFLGVGSVLGHVWFAFAGAAVTSVVVYLLGSSGRKLATPDRLVVAGAAVTAVLYALDSAVLLLKPRAFDEFRFWTVGALTGRYFDVLYVILPFVAVGLLIALGLAPSLNALALGDQMGRALGVNVGRTRVLGAIAVMLLCGAATAAVGPISFVGLVVPHIARFVVGPDQRWVMAYSMLLSPVLLIGADVLGRLLGAPGELQVGIVTAFLGAPLFLALCRRRKLVML